MAKARRPIIFQIPDTNRLLLTLFLIAYVVGLFFVLFLLAYFGQRFVQKVQWAANPHGWFKQSLGVLFILVGIFIFTGADKKLQAYLLQQGFLMSLSLNVNYFKRLA